MQQRTRDRGIGTSGHEKTPPTCVDGVEEVYAASSALETRVAPLHSHSFPIELQACHFISVGTSRTTSYDDGTCAIFANDAGAIMIPCSRKAFVTSAIPAGALRTRNSMSDMKSSNADTTREADSERCEARNIHVRFHGSDGPTRAHLQAKDIPRQPPGA